MQISGPSKFRTKTLVFRYAASQERLEEDCAAGDSWVVANAEHVTSLFRDNERLRARFTRFLKRGFICLFLVRTREWIAYGWATQPGRDRPPHLPRWVERTGGYWMFFCHTREGFRGQGIYGQLLRRIVAIVASQDPSATIYVDAYPENIPSRSAIVSAGFVPAGVTTTYKLWLPRIGSLALAGRWRRNENHPSL